MAGSILDSKVCRQGVWTEVKAAQTSNSDTFSFGPFSSPAARGLLHARGVEGLVPTRGDAASFLLDLGLAVFTVETWTATDQPVIDKCQGVFCREALVPRSSYVTSLSCQTAIKSLNVL